MNEEKLNIWVLSHKDVDKLFDYDECYKQMHIGAAINPETKCEYKDNIGINISEKNPFYCELTGIYWVWKNAVKKDYVGFEHYRRHFNLPTDEILSILNNYDVILPEQREIYTTIRTDYFTNHSFHDWLSLEEVVKRLYPDYIESWDEYFNKIDTMYYRNMFITTWDNFESICNFIFSILDEFVKKEGLYTPEDYANHIEKYAEHTMFWEHNTINTDWRTYQMRICGFIAERLTTLWMKHNIKPEKRYELEYETNGKLMEVNKIKAEL